MSKMLCNAHYIHWMLTCLLGLTAIAAVDDTVDDTDQPAVSSAPYNSKVLDQLEAKVDSLSKETLSRMVPALITLFERKEPTIDWRILRLLTKADLTVISEPQRFVDSVSRLLDDPEQATRGLAVDVLCAVGDPAVAASIAGLKSTKPRVRACCAVVLTRLGKLSEADAVTVSRDTDARVRVATLTALGKTPKGTDALIAMLSDEESAVACRAAEQLGRLPEKEEPEKIVRGLENALSRPEVAFFSARSLARMGSDARSAIPKLLAAHPVGHAEFVFSDEMVELAMARIGEPREEDIDEIVSFLEHGNAERRILVCQALARLGTKAKSVSPALEKVMRLDLARDKKQDAELKRGSDQHQRFIISADAALSAYWFVTRDVLAFRSLAEEWPAQLWLGHDFWSILSDSDRAKLIASFMQSNKSALVTEAVNTIAKSPPIPSLEPKIESMMRADAFGDQELLANAWLSTLTASLPNVEDRMLVALEGKLITVDQFARNARRLNCGNKRSLGVLLDGAKTLEKYSAQVCAETYLQLAVNRVQAAEEIGKISNLESDFLPQVIASERWDSPELASFAETLVHNSASTAQVDGIRILSNIGKASPKAISEIKNIFEKEIKEKEQNISSLATTCAVAIFKLEGNTAYVDRVLQRIADRETTNKINAKAFDYERQGVLQEIVAPGSKYTDFVLTRLNAYDPLTVEEIEDSLGLVDGWIRLALRTKSPKARDCVIRFSNSKDVLLARLARERLRDEK